MPRKRRIAKGRAVALELTEALECALLDGHIFDAMFPAPPTPDVLRQAWEVYGPDLLAEWVAERPGSRPWAWWEWDAPEPRRRHVGGSTPACDLADAPDWVKRISFGICPVIGGAGFTDPPQYETEAVYLARHGLLSEAERTTLAGLASGTA